ncbi:MAG: hypothetical protein V4510_11470 [bacterium]
MQDSAALARRNPEQEAKVILGNLRLRVLKVYAGMYESPNSADYNADGELSRRDVPMRTAAAIEAVTTMLRGDAGGGNVTINIRHLALPAKEEAREYVDAVTVDKAPGDG